MKIGAYEVTGELGRGAMGIVFRALGPRGDEVAIKVLAKVKEETVARFDRERRLAGSFTAREGFVPLLDAGTAPQGPYLVMPLVSGGTLRDRLKNGALGLDETLALGTRLANAISLAHARGIVHRDLKPENVLFDAQGTALIADLGLAKHFDSADGVSLSRSGALRGTAGYMAPEQAADAKSAGPPADVFALGAILHECLTGRAAFEGEGFVDVLARVAEGKREPLVGVPSWVVAVIDKALAVDPARRFASGAELAEALDGKTRARSGVPLVAGILLVAALVGGWFTWRAAQARSAVTAAWTALAARDHATALRRADEALAVDSSNAAAWCVRAEARLGLRDFKGALVDFDRSIELDPKDPRAWTGRGDTHTELGKFDRAIADTTRAIELAPTFARAWKERGVARLSINETDPGIADLDRAIALDPSNPRSWGNRAFARQFKGDHKGVLEDMERAIALEPGLSRNFVMRASSHLTLGNLEAAIADCNRGLALNPSDAHAWSIRALAKSTKQDVDGALDDYERAVALDGSAVNFLNRGIERFRKGDREEDALKDFEQAILLDPKLGKAYFQRGAVKQRRKQFEDAIRDFDRAIELDPTCVLAWFNRAFAKNELNDLAGATTDLEHYCEINPGDLNIELLRRTVKEWKARLERRRRTGGGN